MLLVIDVGNTNIVFALFSGADLQAQWRMATRRYQQPDDLGAFLLGMLAGRGLKAEQVAGVAISSVVPPLTGALREMSRLYFGQEPFVVESGVNTRLRSYYDDPRLLGTDRAVNVVAAIHYYGGPAIVADFGTATKFEAINSAGEHLGGAIAPGLNIAAEALFAGSALLYRVDLSLTPEHAIGRDTPSTVRSGIRLGYLSMVEGMVRRFKAELGRREPGLAEEAIKVVATGGLAHAVAVESTAALDVIDPILTLQGIRLVYEQQPSLAT